MLKISSCAYLPSISPLCQNASIDKHLFLLFLLNSLYLFKLCFVLCGPISSLWSQLLFSLRRHSTDYNTDEGDEHGLADRAQV